MKVLFASPSTKFFENISAIRNTEAAILAAGHQLSLDLDDQTMIESAGNEGTDAEDWHILAQREINAAKECDVAIFDVTDKASFGIGYMAAIALAAGKPTLFLMREGSLGGSFINGLEHRNLKRLSYEPASLADTISIFLEDMK